MEVKGTAIKSIVNFIKKKFPDRYEEWLKTLSPKSLKYFKDGVMSGEWYPSQDAYIIPTKVMAELFYNNNIDKAAYDSGKFSAIEALSGIYKIFVRMASMNYILKKLPAIVATYYSSGTIEIIDEGKIKYFKLNGFKKGEEIITARIAGWAEGLFETISKPASKISYSIKELNYEFIEGNVKIEWSS